MAQAFVRKTNQLSIRLRLFVPVLTLLSIPLFAQPTIEDRGSGPESLIRQAESWMRAGLYQRAQYALEEHLRTVPTAQQHHDALYLLVQCYLEDERYEQAYDAAGQLLRQSTASERRSLAQYVRGLGAYQTLRFDNAVTSFTEFLSAPNKHPQRGAALYWRALAQYKLGNWSSAQESAREAFSSELRGLTTSEQRAMGKDHALYLLALTHEQQGDDATAIEMHSRLLSEFPSSLLRTEAIIRQASMALRQSNTSKASELLSTATPETPKQREEWLLLSAEVELNKGEYALAARWFADLLRQFPQGHFGRYARYGLAWAHLKSGSLDAAREEFNKLANGSDSLAHRSLYQSGLLALLQGNITAAHQAFELLVERFPYDVYSDNAYHQLGLLRYRARQYAEARRNFQAAARLYPESEIRAESFRMWGEASIALGDFGNAHFAFSQARQMATTNEALRSTGFLADVLFQEALSLYHLGRFTSSADRFEEFHRSFPRHRLLPEAYFWHAEALFQNGKFGEAERSMTQALSSLSRDHEQRPQAMYVLAWTIFEQRRYRDAAAAFERFIREHPNHDLVVDATLRRADCFFALRDYSTSASLYASVNQLRGDSNHAEYAAFQLGLSLIQRGEIDRGVERLRSFIQSYPNSIYLEVAQFNIAWAFFSREDYARSLEEFRALESAYPESQLMPRVLLNMGDAYYNLAQYDRARLSYQRLIAEYPKSLLIPDAVNGLQFTFQAEGKSREAVAVIDSLMRLNPESESSHELLLQKADLLFGQADYGRAVVEYLQLLGKKPPEPVRVRAMFQLARIYELEGNSSGALSYYQQIIAEAPDHEFAPSALLAVGNLHVKQRRWQEAVTTLAEFAQRYPDSPLRSEAEYNAGIALQGLNNQTAARQKFEAIIATYPAGEVFADRSRLQIARAHQARREFQAAVDTLARVVSLRDDDIAAEAFLLLGELYLALNRYDNALRSFTEVSERFAHFPALNDRALLGMGEAYERKNDRANAIAAYSRLVEVSQDASLKRDAEERLRRIQR
jgi:TolA-binding protein